jgi:hypothetical protein
MVVGVMRNLVLIKFVERGPPFLGGLLPYTDRDNRWKNQRVHVPTQSNLSVRKKLKFFFCPFSLLFVRETGVRRLRNKFLSMG